ncbi:MAG TPA: dihydroorotate dehydrogenase-like protein [Xanthobacteraceae bacterium]|nr:dihydroorotate dehydrogenase-like protein [Xanthobacteraceae bacterium]
MDLSTNYLRLRLANPLIASASPLTGEIANIRQMEDCGAAAIVLPSMFEEQIEREVAETIRLTTAGAESFPEALSYFPPSAGVHADTGHYLETILRARAAVDIPVIASLNGVSDAGWTAYARLAEEAGASAIELNIYFIPTDLTQDGRAVEQRYLDILRAVKDCVDIPVAMKIGPHFSAVGNFVRELDRAGADGFVLFNRFYQPDIDLVKLALQRDLALSSPTEIRLSLLWIGVLAGQVRGSLAAATGVDSTEEVIKYLLAGADAVMTTSALLRHGIPHLRTLLDGLAQWLEARDAAGLDAIRGRMSRGHVPDPTAFERANYMRILQSWSDR